MTYASLLFFAREKKKKKRETTVRRGSGRDRIGGRVVTRAGVDAPSWGRGSVCSGFGRATHRIPLGRASPRRWREGTPSAANDRIGSGDFFFHVSGGRGLVSVGMGSRDPSSLKALLETIVGTAAGGGGVSGRVVTTRRARDRRRGYRAPDPRGTRPPRAPRGACARRSRRTPSVAATISVFSLGRGKRCGCFFPRAAGCGEIAARGREIERAREPGAARYERARSRGAREGRRGAEGASGSRDAASCAPVGTAEG